MILKSQNETSQQNETWKKLYSGLSDDIGETVDIEFESDMHADQLFKNDDQMMSINPFNF